MSGKIQNEGGIYRHYKTHRPTSEEHKYLVCNKVFNKKKYLHEHKQVHTEELPFKCEICEDRFHWCSGHKVHVDKEHNNKESLSDEF